MRMSSGIAMRKTTLALVAAASALALLAAGAPAASAAPTAIAKATPKCWEDVVNDWLQHGTVKNLYALSCYSQAISRLNAYPDIKQYSSAIDDIKRSLLIARREESGGSGPGGSGSGSGGSNSSGGGGGAVPTGGGGGGGGGGATPAGSGHGKGLVTSIADKLGPGNAQSIPLPLLVLGGLGLLLLLTAAATWGTRRLQARRVTGTPAPARAGSSVRPEP